MPVTIKPRICANLTVTDGDVSNVYEIHEEDIIRDLKYRKGSEEITVSGAIRLMNCSTTRATITQTCPPESYFSKMVNITSLVIDCSSEFDADLVTINVSDIIGVGEVERPGDAKEVVSIGVGPQYQTVDNVVASLSDGATLKLAKGDYTPAIAVTKSVKIVGVNDYPRNSAVATMSAEAVESDTSVFSGAISVDSADAEVEIRGMDFTKNALVKVVNAKCVKLINCSISGLIPDITKTMPIAFTGTTPCKIVIEGCYFGDNEKGTDTVMHNLIDVYNLMADGSSISNNVFAADSCVHNHISLYGIDDNAVINCNNNVFAGTGGYRIGFKGTPKGTLNIEKNTMPVYDPEPYVGIMCIQPYGTQTTDFAGINLNFANNNVPEGTICYAYCGGADTQLTEDQLPKVTVDGAAFVPTILH